MSTPSSWPLPPSSIRYLVPKPMIQLLQQDILSSGMYPLAYGYYENAKGHTIQREQHDDHLMMFCIEGKGYIKTPHWQGKLKKNQIVFIPQGVKHEYMADDNLPWSIYWVHLSGHLFHHFMDIIAYNDNHIRFNVPNPKLVETEFQQLMETRLSGYKSSSFVLAANILKKILSLLASQLPKTNAHTKSEKEFNKQHFDLYLQENICNLLTLDEMAEFVGLSKFYFAKKFQQVTGISPIKYFMEKKIQYACYRLDSTDDNIKEVAKHLGYEDPYYFSRLFKNVMGLSPKQYRLSRHGH